jgi:hypothetical protein
VTIELSSSNASSTNGVKVTMTNNDNLEYKYSQIATDNFVIFDDVQFGVYTVSIVHPSFEEYQ